MTTPVDWAVKAHIEYLRALGKVRMAEATLTRAIDAVPDDDLPEYARLSTLFQNEYDDWYSNNKPNTTTLMARFRTVLIAEQVRKREGR